VSNKQIVIVGASYGGLMCALRIYGKTRNYVDNEGRGYHIVLIDQKSEAGKEHGLYKLSARATGYVRQIKSMLVNSDIEYVATPAIAINPISRQVVLESGIGLNYDYLVYAVHSEVDKDKIPGIRQHAYTLDSSGRRGGRDLLEKLSIDRSLNHVLIIGGGAGAIELAGGLVDAYPDKSITILCDRRVTDFSNEKAAKYMRDSLNRRGVKVVESYCVKRILSHEVESYSGERLAFDMCIWAGEYRSNRVEFLAPLPRNHKGQLMVDAYLRVACYNNIFAVGDACATQHNTGAPLGRSHYAAAVTGAYVADMIDAAIKQKSMRVFGFSCIAHTISLGAKDAIAYFSVRDDKPMFALFKGCLALLLCRVIESFFLRLLLVERYVPGLFFWPGKTRGSEPTTDMRHFLSSPLAKERRDNTYIGSICDIRYPKQ